MSKATKNKCIIVTMTDVKRYVAAQKALELSPAYKAYRKACANMEKAWDAVTRSAEWKVKDFAGDKANWIYDEEVLKQQKQWRRPNAT